MHFCRYCYANYDKKLVIANAKKHDVNSPLLIGNIEEGDIIKKHQMISIIDNQISLL